MFIRPYTISQTTLILLALFLWVYLRVASQRVSPEKREHIRWMRQAIVWDLLVILINTLLGVFEDPRLNLLAYFRDPFGLLALHALSQALYATPPQEPFVRRQEPRMVTWIFVGLISLEIVYLIYRLWTFSYTGLIEPKIVPMRLPILLTSCWLVLLVSRKLWIAEEAPGLTVKQRWHRMFFAPHQDVSRFYRGGLLFFLLTVMGIGFFIVGVSSPALPPTWLLVTADIMVVISFLTMLFAYLASSQASTGLEIRLIGAGLTIFLALISVLGWIITLTFLNQQAVAVNPVFVFGTQMQAQFFVTPEPYRHLSAMLSELLTPLLGFAVGGSLVFIWLYTAYYRNTLKNSLGQIITGFQSVQQGNLAYRIPPITWQDEFSQIGTSFNQMTAALQDAYEALYTYQDHLETLVEQRTAQLEQEMELRKRLELRQGIQEERTRIAQETHDGLLQTLMGVRIRLNRGKQLSQRSAESIQAEMAEMASEITQSIQDLRNLINELNEQILPHGLMPAIEHFAQYHQRLHAITIHTDLTYIPGILPLNSELHLLRIVQEALTNASRHGGATEIWIRLGCCQQGERHSLHLRIEDNGHGFDPANISSPGWGLKNMRRRSEQLGAHFEIHSIPGERTVLSLSIPLY